MRTEKTVVQMVRVRLYCDGDYPTGEKTMDGHEISGLCGGEILSTGMAQAGHSPLYRHKCSRCGLEWDLEEVYPRVVPEE
jgi:hypothetical protein